MRRTWTFGLALATVIVTLQGVQATASEDAAPIVATAGSAAKKAVRPTTGLYYNNPIEPRQPGARNVLMQRIMDAAPGSTVRMTSWSVTDTTMVDVIRTAAVRRGVVFKIIGSRKNCGDFTERFRFLTTDSNSASWVRCVTNGGLHQKSYLFTSTGGVAKVTLVGSENMANANWEKQWNDLFQYAGNAEVYGWYAKRFTKIAGNVSTPDKVKYETHTAADGRARVNFLPINDRTPTKEQDPIWDRLDNLPTNPGGNHPTKISIGMFAMDRARGDWIVQKLVEMRSEGAKIRFIAGPCVREASKRQLRKGHIKVLNGYNPITPCKNLDVGDFVHLKAMTARYWENNETNWRSYTGSANWNKGGLVSNFEAAQRMGGQKTWRQYEAMFNSIWAHYRP